MAGLLCPAKLRFLGGRKALGAPVPWQGREGTTWCLLPFRAGGGSLMPGRRWVMLELKTVLSSSGWGCWLCSCSVRRNSDVCLNQPGEHC